MGFCNHDGRENGSCYLGFRDVTTNDGDSNGRGRGKLGLWSDL